MDSRGERRRDRVEEEVHHRRVGVGQDQAEGIVGAGADGAVDVDRLEPLVGRSDRALTSLVPDVGVSPLLPDAGFVLEPELDVGVAVTADDPLHRSRQPPF